MQTYLDLLNTAAYASFNFNSVDFLEDVDQGTGRSQAFVVSGSSPGLTNITPSPEPGTMALLAGGLLLASLKGLRGRNGGAR